MIEKKLLTKIMNLILNLTHVCLINHTEDWLVNQHIITDLYVFSSPDPPSLSRRTIL